MSTPKTVWNRFSKGVRRWPSCRTVSSLTKEPFYKAAGSEEPLGYLHRPRTYPGPGKLFDGESGKAVVQGAFRRPMSTRTRKEKGLQFIPHSKLPEDTKISEAQFHVDHTVELTYLSRLFDTQITGMLPDGTKTTHGAIPSRVLLPLWDSDFDALSSVSHEALPPPVPPLFFTCSHSLALAVATATPGDTTATVDRSKTTANTEAKMSRTQKAQAHEEALLKRKQPELGHNINDRMMEILGSRYNRRPLVLLESGLNILKGKMFNGTYAREERWEMMLSLGTKGMIAEVKKIVEVYAYLFHPLVAPRIRLTRQLILAEAKRLSEIPRMNAFYANTVEFDNMYWDHFVRKSMEYTKNVLSTGTTKEGVRKGTVSGGRNRDVRAAKEELEMVERG